MKESIEKKKGCSIEQLIECFLRNIEDVCEAEYPSIFDGLTDAEADFLEDYYTDYINNIME